MLSDPVWLKHAKQFLGAAEIVGPKHNNLIVQWWKDLSLPYRDDETPWCAGYVSAMLKHSGQAYLKSAWARAYLNYGVKLNAPAVGAIVVFERGSGGHVGFVVGKDRHGNIMVLGGNQSNKVTIAPFVARMKSDGGRVLGYRWPGVWPFPDRFNLPVLQSDGKLSTNEA